MSPGTPFVLPTPVHSHLIVVPLSLLLLPNGVPLVDQRPPTPIHSHLIVVPLSLLLLPNGVPLVDQRSHTRPFTPDRGTPEPASPS